MTKICAICDKKVITQNESQTLLSHPPVSCGAYTFHPECYTLGLSVAVATMGRAALIQADREEKDDNRK